MKAVWQVLIVVLATYAGTKTIDYLVFIASLVVVFVWALCVIWMR